MSGHQRRRATPKIIHNPHQPEGWWRDGADFFVAPPPRCTGTSRRRRFANSTPSRSPQTSPYLWNEALSPDYASIVSCSATRLHLSEVKQTYP